MKIFSQEQLREAYAHATAGGQALHVCKASSFVTSTAPACFKRAEKFAHLIDYDRTRLERTARRLGVRVIVVERAGGEGQHVDLCGQPLQRALRVAATVAEIQSDLALLCGTA